MFAWLWVSVAVCICTMVWVRWARMRGHWAQHNVLHDRPHPLLGNLTCLFGDNLSMVWMRSLYDRFSSPYMGIWSFWQPVLVINNPEIAHRILHTHGENFKNRFSSARKSDVILSQSIFLAKEPDWSPIRHRLAQLFTFTKLRTLQPIISRKSNELITRINNMLEKKQLIDLYEISSDFTTDLVSTKVLGMSCNSTLTGKGPMKDIINDVKKLTLYNGVSWLCVFFLPKITDTFNLSAYPRSYIDALRYVLNTLVNQRSGHHSPNRTHDDVLDTLLKIMEGNTSNGELDTEWLVSQVGNLLHAGFHTPAMTIAYAIYELAFAPEIQEKLFNELSDANISCQKNTEIDTSRLNYLQCVIKETLRKYPPVGWIDRVSATDYKIDENLTIAAGTPVFVNIVGIHYDPDFYPDPETFKPDRFLPENQSQLKPHTFLAYGNGPRRCLAGTFGSQMVEAALVSTLLNFEVRPVTHDSPSLNSHGPRVPFVKRSPLVYPANTLTVQFVPRRDKLSSYHVIE